MDQDAVSSMDESEDVETSPFSIGNDNDDDDDDDIDEEKIEKLWAKEQYEMSRDDREAATNEMHGVQSRYNASEYENPESHYKALIQFDQELNNPNRISGRVKNGYFRALQMNSTYVSSPDFRLRFLRTEFFDVPKAALRFCKCLNILVETFGDVSLLRQIFLSDLTKNERKLLKEGGMQLSPTRDSLGRRTMFLLGNFGAKYSSRERDRVGLYLLFQVVAEDVTTQRNGVVSVHMMSSADIKMVVGGENKHRMSSFFQALFEGCPVRFSAVHMCFPNELLYRLLKPLMLFVVGNAGRKVLKIHSGTTVECNYSLSSFGVHEDDVPVTYSGTIKTRQHTRWLKARVAMDGYIDKQCKDCVAGDYRYFYASERYTIKPFPHIQCPEINCVLFHKNGVAWDFPGNIKFRAFLDVQLPNSNHLNNRHSGNIPEKEGLFDRIIRLSFEQNFHFLLHDETKHWYNEFENPDVLRRYIGFAIRGRQRRVRTQKQRQGSDSSDSGKIQNNNAKNKTDDRNPDSGPTVFTNMDGKEGNYGSDSCFALKL